MAYYPPPGSHHSAVYPATPIPSAAFPAPQLHVPQPPMMIVPSRVNSRHSHHSHVSQPPMMIVPSRVNSRHSHHSHRSRHDDDYDYDRHHDRDRDYRDRDYYDRGRDYHDHDHDRDRDRHHKHRSHSRHRSHHHSDRDKRHRDKNDRKHRSHRRHHTAPQVIVPPQMVAPYPGQMGVAPSVGYPYPYDYRPSFGQRLRQFFGFAPASPQYQYKSNTHSWGFLGRSKRPRYVDARTGVEVDRHGRTVHRI